MQQDAQKTWIENFSSERKHDKKNKNLKKLQKTINNFI